MLQVISSCINVTYYGAVLRAHMCSAASEHHVKFTEMTMASGIAVYAKCSSRTTQHTIATGLALQLLFCVFDAT